MEPNSPFEPFDNNPQNLPKQRHGCVSAWLIFMITTNALAALTYLFNGDELNRVLNMQLSPMMILLLAFLGIGNVIFAIMLLQWKKIGFYGFIITTFVSFGINITLGNGVFQAIFGLIGIGVLFGILQIKRNNKSAWENME